MTEPTPIKNHLFCFGYGYTCDYLGHNLLEKGWTVSGTTRSATKREELIERGINAHLFDYERPLLDPFGILDGVTHLLISTPPNADGDPVFKMHAQDLIRIPSIKWVGYLSTTGVYGDKKGDWVDETTETNPNNQRSSRRLKAEDQWKSVSANDSLPLHIFRLSGIYGPGRSALDTVRAGVAKRIHKEGHSFSRIHVEDIAQILEKSMNAQNSGSVYNVCDDQHAASHEVIEYACSLLGRPLPPLVNFEHADLAPITRSFYMDNRRVKNDKIKEELGVSLQYPDYKSGLKGCLEAEEHALKKLQDTETGGIPGFSFSKSS